MNIGAASRASSVSERMIRHYEKIELIKPENREKLYADLHERLGIRPSRVEVGRIDLLRDTALLILASAAAAWAVRVARAGQASMVQRARRGLLVASGLALGFLVSKSMDFVDKFHQGLSMSTDDFWLFYFSLTFFHFLHVVLGLVILMLVWHKLRPLRTFTDDSLNWIESGTAYWHMVDLVWIVLFALVYVAR